MTTPISQKEYPQKYLTSDDKLLHKKKKKKKDKEKPAVKSSTVKIIDDDDHARFDPDPEIDEGELYALNEEAPQVVGVIDERAPEVLMKQEYIDSGKWKSLASDMSKKKKKRRSPSVELVKSRDRHEVIDLSPPRRKRQDSSDNSPVRKAPHRRDSDASPPRRSQRRRDSPDNSPPRRSRKDDSPPRRKRKDSDASPPRKHDRRPAETSTSSRRRISPDNSPPRRRIDSPVRRNRRDSDNSPPRKSSPERSRKKSRWASKSPEPERRQRLPEDNSPPRRSVKVERDNSPPRRLLSPKRVKKESESPPRSRKMTKTLDGKASGLQNAKELVKENEAHRRRQDQLYNKLDPSLSGRNATEIAVRDVRGRNREYEKNYEKDRKKAEAEEIRKQQYDKWNKGIKQLEEFEKKRQEWAHEASKPLARAADDEDLESHLKEQERLDDPMLQYMRSKKKKQDKKDGVLERPQYQGQFPDNRYHIRPGYRWDGVDRSNGYEKKYFNMISAKQSVAEEAYKYSVEDM